jgi:hypothetical protein
MQENAEPDTPKPTYILNGKEVSLGEYQNSQTNQRTNIEIKGIPLATAIITTILVGILFILFEMWKSFIGIMVGLIGLGIVFVYSYSKVLAQEQLKQEQQAKIALIERDEIPEIESSNLRLQTDEKLHFEAKATLSKITTRHGQKYFTKECSGNFWVSNKRLGFNSVFKNLDIPFSKILSCDSHGTDDGFIIYKKDREKPYIINEMKNSPVAEAIVKHYLISLKP